MLVDIFVVRLPADRRGEDIVEPYISSSSVALARGTTEIDKSTPVFIVSADIDYRTGIRVGQLVEVFTAFPEMEPWRGKITSLSHIMEQSRLKTKITIDKVQDV